MSPYDFVPLVLLASGGKVQGRTKLQKLVYFAAERTQLLGELGYRPHFYGPYSAAVADAVEGLRGLLLLDQRVVSRSADAGGFEVTRYDYELTDDGRQVAERLKADYPNQWTTVETAIRPFQDADYMRLSIAAKAHFLLSQAGGVATTGQLQEMTPKFGWSVSSEQIDEAGQLLQSAGLVQVGG